MMASVLTGSHRRAAHADSRLPQILDTAAHLFCTQGYQGTTVRDIASAVGILPGSLYCHFSTKDDLLAAVYVRGVDQICAAVEAAIAGIAEPWSRLEAACVAHLDPGRAPTIFWGSSEPGAGCLLPRGAAPSP